MKKFLSGLFLAMLAWSTSAQFMTGPVGPSLITNATTLAIAPAAGGGAATNFSLAQCPFVTIGKDAFGVAIKSFGTNAALTTNVWITLEFTADGVNAITNNNVTVVLLPTGTATNTYYTNFVLSSSSTIGNVLGVRAKNIMQTNGLIGSSLAGSLFIEKFFINSR